jgi:hypothetical protein
MDKPANSARAIPGGPPPRHRKTTPDAISRKDHNCAARPEAGNAHGNNQGERSPQITEDGIPKGRAALCKALPFGVPFFRFFPHERKESAPGGTDKPPNPAGPPRAARRPGRGKRHPPRFPIQITNARHGRRPGSRTVICKANTARRLRRMGFQREGRLCAKPFPLACLSSDSFRTNGKNRPPEGRTSQQIPPGHPGRLAAPAPENDTASPPKPPERSRPFPTVPRPPIPRPLPLSFPFSLFPRGEKYAIL